MTDILQCDDCGARNAADARWCSQCYRLLVVDEPAGVSLPSPAPMARTSTDSSHDQWSEDASPTRHPRSVSPGEPPPHVVPPPSPRIAPAPAGDGLLPLPPGHEPTSPPPPTVVEAGDGRFRRVADGLEWRCDTCESWNPLERTGCVVCGAAFLETPDESGPSRQVDPALLIGATVVLPGAGHALLHLWGQAFFRGLLALVWGVGGTSLLLDALAVGQPVLPAVPLLLGWLVLVAASVNDVLVAGGGEGRVLLQGRPVLWLVMSVIGATVAMAFVGALTAVGG